MGKRILIAVLLLILALPSAGLVYLLYSEQGLKLALAQLDRFGNLSIRVDGATGRLAGPLNIQRFELKLERVHIVIDDLHADLRSQSLLAGVLDVRTLSAGGVAVRIARGGDKRAQPPRFLPGNLRIRADAVQLRRVNVVYADLAPFTADTLDGRVSLSRQRLYAEQVRLTSPEYALAATVELRARSSVELDIAADGRYTLRGQMLEGHAELAGVPAALTARAQLTAPSPLNVVAELKFPQGAWQVTGSASSSRFDLTTWWASAPFSLRDASLNFSADAQALNVEGALSVPELGALPLRIKADGNYRDRRLRVRGAEVTGKSGALRVLADGEFALGSGDVPLRARARWQGLTWPLTGSRDTALIASDHGELNLSGAPPYRFALQAELASSRLLTTAAAQLAAEGTLSKESLSVAQYRLTALNGTLEGSGQLAFAPPRTWSLRTEVRDLDPAALHAQFPGRIAARLSAAGQGLNKNATFTAQLSNIGGQLRNETLRGHGELAYASQNWRLRGVQLDVGATHLEADGSIGRQLALRAALRSSDLRNLDFGAWSLSGAGEAEFEAHGPRQSPRLVVRSRSDEFAWAEWRVGTLRLDAEVDLADTQPLRIDAAVGRVTRGGYVINDAQLAAEGRLTNHRLTLSTGLGTLQSKPVRLQAEVQGGYARQSWSGRLVSATLADAQGREHAHLLQEVTANLSTTRAEVAPFCFTFDDSRNCAQGRWQRRGAWQVAASIENFPLSAFDSAGTEALRYDGRLAANINLGAATGEPWQGNARVDLADAAVRYLAASGRYESFPIRSAHLDMIAAGRRLSGMLSLQAGDSSRMNASVELQQQPGIVLTRWPLQAQLRVESADAKLLPLWVPDLDRVSGMLDAAVEARGTLARPALSGTVQLRQGETDIDQLNLALREINFLARLQDNRVELEGRARAGEGTLNLRGGFEWSGMKPSGTLRLKGEQLLVADLPEYRVVASPDLFFSVADARIDVVGDILIPSARLQPQAVTGAVQVSSDARLLTDRQLTQENRWSVSSEVRITLGEDVRVDALGLQGRLAGSVGTTFRPGDPAIGRGELNIQNGVYEAYGRKLDISRGRLLFEAAPLDDPGLDIQAERKIEDITVGVNVRGFLRAPRLQFYSEPTMSQTEIVSYLLIGKPLDELQGSDTATVQSASNTLAIQGGGFVAAQLGRRIGLEQVGVETDSNNQSALVLGKFLSPRLFVSYGISLTQAINTLKLRYTLSDHWLLKTEAGNAQSADIEFKIER